MVITAFTERITRLARCARDMRRGGATYRTVIAYYLKFLARKRIFVADFIRAKLGRGALERSLADRATQTTRPAVLITAGGSGMGDDIVIARFLRDLQAACGEFDFDVACASPDRSRQIFSAVPGFGGTHSTFAAETIMGNYKLVIDVSHVAQVRRIASGSPDPMLAYPRLAAAVAALQRFGDAHRQEIEGLPYTTASLARLAVFRNETRATSLHAQAEIAYGGPRLEIAEDPEAHFSFGLTANTYVTIHNGFDPAFVVASKRATKCYPHFGAVVRQLKQLMPALKIVQIGRETSVPIEGVDCDLLMRTTLPQVAAVLAGALLHIDNESGLVHLAAALGVRSCVVCGPTDADYFSYSGNITLRPPVCGGCWWTTESWMDICPRGFAEPPCISSQPPESVTAAVLAALAGNSAWTAERSAS